MPELIPLRRGEILFDKNRFGNLRFINYIEELTGQVNTATSATGEITTQLAQNLQSIARINELEKKQLKTIKITADYTAKPYDQVVGNNTGRINVTTPINPKVNDIFNVKRKSAAINVIGTIDGKINKCINVKGYNMKLLYDGDEWIEV